MSGFTFLVQRFSFQNSQFRVNLEFKMIFFNWWNSEDRSVEYRLNNSSVKLMMKVFPCWNCFIWWIWCIHCSLTYFYVVHVYLVLFFKTMCAYVHWMFSLKIQILNNIYHHLENCTEIDFCNYLSFCTICKNKYLKELY